MAVLALVRRFAGAFLIAALLSGIAVSHAAPPPEIATAAPYFPENTKAVIVCHLTPEVREWLFSSFFVNPQIYRKVVTEQADKFAKATGFNPMEDIEWDVLAVAENPPTPILVAIPTKDPMKMLEALQKDPKTAPLIKTEAAKGATIVRIEQLEMAFTPKLMIAGMAGTVKPLVERGAESPTNKTFLEQVAAGPFTGSVVYGMVAPAPETMQALAANPNVSKFGGAVLGRVKQIAFGMDFKEVSLVLKLDSKDAALVAGDQVKGLLTSAKGLLSPVIGKPEVATDANALEHINPKIILTRILALSGLDMINAIVVSADNESTKITVPKEKVPFLRAEGSTMLIAIAAMGGGVYGAMQAKGGAGLGSGGGGESDAQAQCYANQQRLTAAVELYNSDKKKKAKLEEIADQLVAAQYLESKPDCPAGANTFGNYQTAADGRVTCKVHGSPEASEPSEGEKAEPEKGAPPAKDDEEKKDGEE
jgi:hypothetical protein